MNKCIKVLLIVCGVIATTGIILSIVGVCIGGNIKDITTTNLSIFDSIRTESGSSTSTKNESSQSDKLVNASYDINDTISELHLDIGAAKVKIVTGDTFRVEVTDEPEDYIIVETKGGTLSLKENENYDHTFHFNLFPLHFSSNSFDTKVTITIPETQEFKKVDMSVQAGSLTVDKLVAEEGKVDIDAGSFIADTITFENSSNLSVDAGSIQIKNELATEQLEAEVNAGSIDIKNATITKDSKVDCNAGTITLSLSQDESYYGYDVNSSIGSVKINNQRYNDVKSMNSNSNQVELKIKCDVGTVNVTTK